MIKFILLLFFLVISLSARENPFFNVSGENMPITSNKDYSLELLKKASIALPSTARVIQSVSVKYKNLDGSQTTKTIKLNNAIDWHLPIFISQNYNQILTVKKSKTKKFTSSGKYKKIGSLKFISLYANGKKLKILTKDKMIRNFTLVNPHRLVLDFKRNIHIRSYSKILPKDFIFTKIRLGNHKNYYRIVVELDGYYSYRLKKNLNTYIITLQ